MLPINTLLQARYEIIEQIGRGGMGAVYKATDTRLRSIVALKQTLVEGEALRRAFEREAQLLAGLRHPTLPRVSDHFIEGSGQFLVMEFIPGDDLGAMLAQRGTFATADVLRWADQLLDTLEYLHTRKPPIIHRDIKPQNLKLTERSEIILLDFGLAKGAAAQTRVTSMGSIFGYTPHYAPLEQVQGTGTDPRSDLYSLAATMYHLLTGKPPVDTLTRASARINEEPDPLEPVGVLAPAVPPAVAAVLTQALSLRADQRPPTAVAMRALLRDAARSTAPLEQPVSSSGVDTIVEPKPPLVLVAADQRVTAQLPGATRQLPISVTPPTDSTIAQTPVPRIGPPSGTLRRPAWLLAAILGAAALIAVLAIFAFRSGDQAQQPTTPAAAVGEAASPTSTIAVANSPAPTLDILKAADATRTSLALFEQDVVNRVDKARTEAAVQTNVVFAATATGEALVEQSVVALTGTPAAAPTDTAVVAPTAALAPTAAPRPTRPANTPGAPPPSATPRPAPSATAAGGNAAVLD
ncbi:MAG: protein kinase, partial [Chloroflexales bacterium]|nr:protein kinase [Chloroflexales bacterium]